MLFKTVGW